MRIGVVSDTHGQVVFTRQAVAMLESCQVEQVIHCGDIGSVEIVKQFTRWPTHFVFGNVDDNREELRQAMAAGGHVCHERQGELELASRQIAFLHGDDTRLLGDLVTSQRYDLVCHGHTHVARHVIYASTHVLNPGALYRAAFHSLALLELPELEITLVKLQAWRAGDLRVDVRRPAGLAGTRHAAGPASPVRPQSRGILARAVNRPTW